MSLDPRRIEVVDDQMAAVYRRMTSAELLNIANGIWRSTRTMLYWIIRDSHPDWDDSRIRQEIARRLLDGAE